MDSMEKIAPLSLRVEANIPFGTQVSRIAKLRCISSEVVSRKEVLSQYHTPEDMLTVSTRKLTALLEKASRGRLGKEKVEQLKAAAAGSFGVSSAKDTFAGLDVLATQSEEFTGTLQRIPKRSSPYLRWAIWMARLQGGFLRPHPFRVL